jgi:DNA polymerase III epsilon subunit-like protein
MTGEALNCIHVIDFEGCARTGIIEFGVVTLRELEIVETRSELCKPDAPVTPQETLVHGLKSDMLDRYAGFAEYQDYFFFTTIFGYFGCPQCLG